MRTAFEPIVRPNFSSFPRRPPRRLAIVTAVVSSNIPPRWSSDSFETHQPRWLRSSRFRSTSHPVRDCHSGSPWVRFAEFQARLGRAFLPFWHSWLCSRSAELGSGVLNQRSDRDLIPASPFLEDSATDVACAYLCIFGRTIDSVHDTGPASLQAVASDASDADPFPAGVASCSPSTQLPKTGLF